jgi:hypothetical protein
MMNSIWKLRKKWCFSLRHGDFKMLAVEKESYRGGMNLHDLYPFDDGPLVGFHAVDHGKAL